jgi:SAM-dependent methyltransferase
MSGQLLHQSSSGHFLSDSTWLDAHFEACREEYECLLEWAPIEPGMSVLDAGCGAGSSLPGIRRKAGSKGRVFGLDFDAANCCIAQESYRDVSNGVTAGTVLALPYRDGCLDAVWCANTAQYFDEEGFCQLMCELSRVVRPGGVVVLKDVDMTGFKILPAPELIGPHLAEAAITGPDVTAQSIGSLRGRELRGRLEKAGLLDVHQSSMLIERWGPIDGADLVFWSEWLPYLAAVARDRRVPADDLAVWSQICSPELAAEFVSRADFYGCELQVVAYGTVGVKP